jgi:hypothetical protein
MGRLTLNPIAHISLFGTIIMPLLVHFGWAKPVPVNFSVLNKKQIFLVAFAGPAANLLLACALAVAFHLLRLKAVPFAGDFVLLAILFNIILAVFNLIPIPPLDGSRMVHVALKSPRAINAYRQVGQFGLLLLIGFLFLGGFERIILPVVGLLYGLLRLPVPALTIKDARSINNENKSKEMIQRSKQEVRTQLDSKKCGPISSTNLRGGTIINIIIALIFFALLASGILWLIKSFADVGQEYGETMVKTTYRAETVKCQTNLRAIGQNIQMYAISNNEFPPSQEALVEWSGTTQLFHCPATDGERYVYIPGQNSTMSPMNILVYEPKPVHDGRCSVLRLGGQIELLTPEELQQAVAQTLSALR